MASTRDESKQPAKRPRHDDAQAAPARVQLNPADCDLDFFVDHGGLRGHALHGGGFAYCWSGARATAGVRRGGRYCFGCRVVAEQAVDMDDTEAGQRHLFRVGVSRGDDAVGSLGEAGGHSFAFEGTSKLCHDEKLIEYGAEFGVGDTVICAVDLDSRPMASIRFCKNREWLGEAQSFDAFASEKGFGLVDAPAGPRPWESAIFPHVLLKNVIVEMQFGMEDGLEPVNGYQPWSSALAHGNAVSGPVFAEHKECEILMMVGLPASGKTTWAEKLVREYPEKRFILVGLNLALDQLKMAGLLRNRFYDERLDSSLDRAAKVVEGLLGRAASVPRNYILDQTNLERIARIRLLNNFSSYGRKIAVVVFPAPAERKCRSSKRFIQAWKEVPDDTVNKMAANFALPMSKDMPGSMEPFDQVLFVELSRGDAQTYLDQMTSNRGYGSNAFSQDASARGWQSTSHNQMRWRSSVSDKQSSSNAPTEPSSSNAPDEKDKQVDSDFIVSKKFELAHEYEEMDREYKNIREMSRGGQASEAAADAAWAAFEARLDKCRAIQREIINAKGDPQPIPEWFLLGKDFVRLKNLELTKELELAVESQDVFIKMSGRGLAPADEMKLALAAFEGHLKKCRAIQREIREARGDPVPIPEELLDYY